MLVDNICHVTRKNFYRGFHYFCQNLFNICSILSGLAESCQDLCLKELILVFFHIYRFHDFLFKRRNFFDRKNEGAMVTSVSESLNNEGSYIIAVKLEGGPYKFIQFSFNLLFSFFPLPVLLTVPSIWFRSFFSFYCFSFLFNFLPI